MIKSLKFKAELIENNIFYLKYSSKQMLNAKDFEEAYNCYCEMGKNQPLKALIEVDAGTHVDFDVATCEVPNTSLRSRAKAIVTDSLAIRLFVKNTIISQQRQNSVKVFKSKVHALNWLASVA